MRFEVGTLRDLIDVVREVQTAPPISDDELPTDCATFGRYYFTADGLAWLSDLFGAELTRDPDSDELLVRCGTAAEARRIAELTGYVAHDANVALPSVLNWSATSYPDDIRSDADGAITGWTYPVPQPGETDAWGWQGIADPLPGEGE